MAVPQQISTGIGIDVGLSSTCAAIHRGGVSKELKPQFPSLWRSAVQVPRHIAERREQKSFLSRWFSSDRQPDTPRMLSDRASWILRDISTLAREREAPVVLAVPAYFNDVERQQIRDQALAEGFDVKRLANAPSAAVAHHSLLDSSGLIAVISGAGEGLDSTLGEVENGVFEVLAADGARGGMERALKSAGVKGTAVNAAVITGTREGQEERLQIAREAFPTARIYDTDPEFSIAMGAAAIAARSQ